MRAADMQCFELGQAVEMFKPLIGDLGPAEAQEPELGQAAQMLQAGIRDLGPAEEQDAQIGQAAEMLCLGTEIKWNLFRRFCVSLPR